MPRPTTKDALLEAAKTQFDKLWMLINSMIDDPRTSIFSFEDRDKNARDVLVHLYEWHQLLISWVSTNQSGDTKPFLPEPYNWKTYPKMNAGFWEKHQSTQYDDAVKLLKESHAKVIKIIESFSDEELFTKKYFSWTGTTSLASYCISSTSSHYDWAMKKLKRHIKTCKA